MIYAKITGWGKCLPPVEIQNEDIIRVVDTSDEWITTRTGIKSRRVSHVSTAELPLWQVNKLWPVPDYLVKTLT